MSSSNTPRYSSPMEFNMGGGLGRSASNPARAANSNDRDTEQRMARMAAESEYKLLEERNRANEREQRLRDELARERATILAKGATTPLSTASRPLYHNPNAGVAAAHNNNNNHSHNYSAASPAGGGATPAAAPHPSTAPTQHHHHLGGGGAGDAAGLRAEVERLNALLADANIQITDAEQRYQREKRELLNYRTAQLKSETSKKGQEGDVIARAMQVMSEYESVIRSSEENSLARLAHHMESFEKEWVRRTREFEENKGTFEAEVMEKALEALRSNNEDIEAIGSRIMGKTLEVLKAQGETRLKLEEEVLAHSEAFKAQYKQILENEFRQRCRAYDDQIAERERNLVNIIHEERERVIAEERKAVEKYEAVQMKALSDAMKDISDLREQLVREHQETQAKGVQELMKRRQELIEEQNVVLQQTNERIASIEAQCFEAVEAAQRSLKDMQLTMAAKEVETAERLIVVDMEREKGRVEEISRVRAEVEAQWKEAMDELRQRHSEELSHQLTELQTRIDLIHSDQFQREQELRRSYEEKLVRMEESSDERWAKRVQETTRSLDRHLEVIQALREDNEQLSAQLAAVQEKFQLRETEVAGKIFTVQREHEQLWHQKMEEMRIRYDRLLDEALGGAKGGVSAVEYNRMAGMLKIAEDRIVDLKRSESDTIEKEREQLNEMWAARLSDERADRAVWEQDQLKKLAELRVELQADSRKKETEMMCRIEQEKLKVYDTHTRKVLEEKRDRDAFEESVRAECEARIREAEEEFEEAYESKVAFLEKRFEEKHVDLEAKRKAMRRDMTDFEAVTKKRAAEWLAKEKEEILADVREFHDRLQQEEATMQEKTRVVEREMQEKYSNMFESAKAALEASTAAMATLNLEHWREVEEAWLETRAQELEIFLQMKVDHEARHLEVAAKGREDALRSAEEIVTRERAEMEKRETAMHAEIERIRQTTEASARDRICKALDERNAIQEESEKARAREEAQLWESIQLRILEKERQGERERRVLEMELRTKYESLIATERQRVDEVIGVHADEQRAFTHKLDADNRRREEEWAKHRSEIEAKERDQHEARYSELRRQCEERVQQERERHERISRERADEFESERQKLLDSVEKQYGDHEAAMRLQVTSMREDYEKRIKVMSQEMYQQRERFIADLAAQQAQLQSDRQGYETDAMNRFEKVIADLRSTLERRAKEQQERELEAMAAIERGKREYEARINKQYEDLLKAHQEGLLSMQRERDERAAAVEKQHQEDLVKLRGDTERALGDFIKECDDRSAGLAAETKAQFEEKISQHHAVLTEERTKRVEAEGRVQELSMELEVLRSGVEQHKIDIQRSLQNKFEALFAELRERTRQEKEDMAKAMLAEEEKKLAAEIARRDNDYRLHAVREGQRQALSQQLQNAANPAASFLATPHASTSSTSHLQQQHGYATPSAPSMSLGASTPTLSAADVAAVEQAKKKRERLHQLWQLLDYPHEERNRFLEGVVGFAPRDILTALSDEVRRLELMLPLLETITRKEFVTHRIGELSKQKGKQQQVDDFLAELEKLWARLARDVEAFEARNNNTPFVYRGRRFLDDLALEMKAGIRGVVGLTAVAASATAGNHSLAPNVSAINASSASRANVSTPPAPLRY